MKNRLIATVLATLALSAPAMAQNYQPQGYPPQGYEPQSYEAGILRPREIMTMLRSTGFDPIDRPMRRGPNYVLRAVDGNDREVTLVINGRSGHILSATPVRTASRMQPGVSMGEWQRMPPGYSPPLGYVPQPGYRPGAPMPDDEADDAPPSGPYGARPMAPGPGAPGSAVPGPGAPPRYGSNPPPANGPEQPGDEADADPQSDPHVITADPQGGLLPPPPERFPQRAAPVSPPKPVKRAAAAPPKTAPLPKPKPAAPSASASAEAAPPKEAPKSPAPAKMPAPEETPI